MATVSTQSGTPEQLAGKFIEVLKEWLTPEQLATVVERNNLPQYSGACATHDFCDANMAMDKAFTEYMGREFDFGSDEDNQLFNHAWNIARRNNFA